MFDIVNNVVKVLKRIVFYIRVSTDAQDKAETNENQLRDLYKVYNKADVVVIKVYEDTGSGADPDRPDLKQLREDAKKGLFDVVAIWDTSRLARDIMLALTLREEFKSLGIKIEVMGKERDDSDDAKIYTLIESWMDERERVKIKSRFTSGKNRRLAEGKLIGSYPAFGYDHVRRDKEKGIDAYFKVNEQEAAMVLKIFNLYIELESIFKVAIRLKAEGIKSRGKNGEPGYFQCSTLRKILGNEDYIGNHYFGKTSPCVAKYHIYKVRKHRLTGRKKNPRSEWRSVKVPTIIDMTTWNKAQDILRKRAKFALQESKYEFLSQGLIRCIHCVKKYGGRNQSGYLIYRCPQIHSSNLNQPVCRSRSIAVNKLDTIVWAYVGSLISDSEKIKNNLNLLKEKREKERFSNRNILDSLLREKSNLGRRRNNLLELYSASDVSDNSKKGIRLKLNEFDERDKTLDNQISGVKMELAGLENLDTIEQEVKKTCLLYKKQIENPSFELKKYIVRKWIDEINILNDGSVKINVRIPIGEELKENEKNVEYTYSFPRGILEPQVSLKFEEVINTK